MTNKKVPRRLSTAIMNSLSAGVVPRVGLEYINVGRKDEIEALITDLNNVAEGGAAFRFVVGRYGSGKTFMLQLLRNQALERGYVVVDADLSPDRKLTGSNDSGINSYRELMRNISIKARPDGGALSSILERWISGIQSQVMANEGLSPDDLTFHKAVEDKIYEVIDQMEGLVHGFDFARVIVAYWEGHITDDDNRKDAALRWLRGEYTTKTEARADLGVRVIISDDDWYDYIKLIAQLSSAMGYKGLVVLIDEAVNLYKITHSVSRNNNYEKLLTMFNDTMQGKAEHLYIVIGGTPKFVEDPRRGLYSYEALYTRLAASRFADKSLKDTSGPVIRLKMLDHAELFWMLKRILDVYTTQHNHDPNLSEEELKGFLQSVLNRLGASEILTPREVVRDFISILHLLRQNPGQTFKGIVGSDSFKPSVSTGDPNEIDHESENDDQFSEFTL